LEARKQKTENPNITSARENAPFGPGGPSESRAVIVGILQSADGASVRMVHVVCARVVSVRCDMMVAQLCFESTG